MISAFHHEHTTGTAPVIAPMEEVAAPKAGNACDIELAQLQCQINAISATAQQLENQLSQMNVEACGEAANSSEYKTAVDTVREMRCAADTAKCAVTNAATDPKTGKKMISSQEVTSLLGRMFNFIVGGATETAKVETAAAETSAHAEIKKEKPPEKVTKATEIPLPLLKEPSKTLDDLMCGAVGGPAIMIPRWTHESFMQIGDFHSYATDGWTRNVTSKPALIAPAYAKLLEQAAAMNRRAEQAASAATTEVKAEATAPLHSASETVQHIVAVASEKTDGAITIVIDTFKAGKTMAVETYEKLPSLEQAKAQARGLLSQASTMFADISVPDLSDFIPSSFMSLQGVTGAMGYAY